MVGNQNIYSSKEQIVSYSGTASVNHWTCINTLYLYLPLNNLETPYKMFSYSILVCEVNR